MKIATVDSACSALDENLMPTNIMSMTGIIVDHPYEHPIYVKHACKDYSKDDPNLLVEELKLCQEMLENEKADYVHLDISLGGINILDLTLADLIFKIPLGDEGKKVLIRILPDLQNIAKSIKEKYQIPVLAIGKRSGPVRLAELYAAAYGVSYSMDKVRETRKAMYVGLPVKTMAEKNGGTLKVVSKEPMEASLYAEIPVTNGVHIEPFLNPIVRGFQTLKLTPQEV